MACKYRKATRLYCGRLSEQKSSVWPNSTSKKGTQNRNARWWWAKPCLKLISRINRRFMSHYLANKNHCLPCCSNFFFLCDLYTEMMLGPPLSRKNVSRSSLRILKPASCSPCNPLATSTGGILVGFLIFPCCSVKPDQIRARKIF